MINPNIPSIQSASTPATGAAKPVTSAARASFKAILSEFKSQPMKPLSLQRFSRLAAPRSLAQQIHSDTCGVV